MNWVYVLKFQRPAFDLLQIIKSRENPGIVMKISLAMYIYYKVKIVKPIKFKLIFAKNTSSSLKLCQKEEIIQNYLANQ